MPIRSNQPGKGHCLVIEASPDDDANPAFGDGRDHLNQSSPAKSCFRRPAQSRVETHAPSRRDFGPYSAEHPGVTMEPK
jgi:hypothetical protein